MMLTKQKCDSFV